jgi:SAM-dependent methyltransferase
MRATESSIRERWRTFVGAPQAVPEHTQSARILDVGCGRAKVPGAVGLDANPASAADVLHDLDRTPYPFGDDEFDLVVARHVLEHLERPLDALAELHRITKPSGVVHIVTPHFSSPTSWTDPTHRHHFSSRSFDYLVEGSDYAYYTDVRYEVVRRAVTLGMPQLHGRVVPLLRLLGIEAVVNASLDMFERWWSFALPLGPRDLVIDLRVVKPMKAPA